MRTQTDFTNKIAASISLLAASNMVGEGGFEPPKSVTTDLQSAPFGRSGIPPTLCPNQKARHIIACTLPFVKSGLLFF